MHLLEWIGFHVDQRKQQPLRIRFKSTFHPSASFSLPFPIPRRQMWRVQLPVGSLKRRQQFVKFATVSPGAATKTAGRFLRIKYIFMLLLYTNADNV
jgi:hypothetical protein